ncbi:Na/Pi cotransporter family protein [Aureispira anguillae]|uniref:Na/Pi cotransporter family protein n=1 Tax=Aureispira anguillae TaxID=2864201 RepID=A0A915YB28_9BACT|nr:Na/Pi cotransporter family protein [Aureispira anguillae]BDS09803.1 Na/Pi cotransporter family protein [Aureispira anguillae]
MEFGIWEIVQILGSLAFFIYGMKMMSDGIQRAAGSQLRKILRGMTRNRFLGVFTGFLVTALVQSSSATTVMTVSFVNAGLLSLVESAGVMMGANIGTTITGWIVSILGFKVKLAHYSIPLFAIGVPMFLIAKGKTKYWGEFVIGFAILFMGLSALKGAVPDIKHNPEVLDFLQNFTEWGILSRIFFVFVGALLTVVVQSSSASMAITLTMCAQGWLPLDVAAAMILGENVGTTITAELASMIANTNAKRSARIHSLFNLIGVTWMVLILPYYLPVLTSMAESVMQVDASKAGDVPLILAAFHTTFNTLNVLIMLAFVPWLVKVATVSVKEEEDESYERLKFIKNPPITPELSTEALQKETAHFGEVVSRMNGFLKTVINSIDKKEKAEAIKRLAKYEAISDTMEIEITEYITNLIDKKATHETSTKLRSFMNIANDLERIGDIYYQISKTLEEKSNTKAYFLPEQRNGLNEMIGMISNAFNQMNANLSSSSYSTVEKDSARTLEDQINSLRNKLKANNLDRLGDSDYKVEAAMIYNNIFSSLERVGDHIINVTESILGEI